MRQTRPASTPSMVQAPTNQHTPTNKHRHERHTNQPNKHWHTIEFSHNTRTPTTTPTKGIEAKQPARPYTHPNQTTKSAIQPVQSTRIRQRLFPYRHLTHQPQPNCGACEALSVTLTRLKLHTPTTQHKPPDQTPNSTGLFMAALMRR